VVDERSLQLHRDVAARMGRSCSRKRATHYRKVYEAAVEQAKFLAHVVEVYSVRCTQAEEDGEDCDE